MEKVGGPAFGREFCKALGLDPAKTARVTLAFDTGGLVKARATQYLFDEEAHAMIEVVKRATFNWRG
ncbi:MAG: hypothetical protein V2A79_01075 [Planctomycetota bacterium]